MRVRVQPVKNYQIFHPHGLPNQKNSLFSIIHPRETSNLSQEKNMLT